MKSAAEVLRDASDIGAAGRPMLDVALCLAEGGWPVFPCGLDKKPLVAFGFKARSREVEKIRQWWTVHPEALIGIVPGDQGLAALDVDSPQAMQAAHKANALGGLIVETAGTSKPFQYLGEEYPPAHIYLQPNGTLVIPGVIVRQHSGYVIAPGSRREGRMYRVISGAPEPVAATPKLKLVRDSLGDRAPDADRAAAVIRQMPNNEDRVGFVSVAHMINGALGEEGRDLFLEWARKWDGPTNEEENARVWDTLPPSQLGWRALWNHAASVGVDTQLEREEEARADFDCPVPIRGADAVEQQPPPADSFLKTVEKAIDRYTKAETAVDKALAARWLRAAGFGRDDIQAMVEGRSAASVVDCGHTIGELLQHPELLETPPSIVPYLCWAGTKTLLSAREKTGKTTLAMAGVISATKGEPFLDTPTEPIRVLWMSEESLPIVFQRALQMGAPVDNLILHSMGHNPPAELRVAIAKHRPQLVVIDTIYRFAMLEDENNSGAWIPTVLLLDEFSAQGISFLLLHHSQKSSEHGQYRGSTALGAHVDAILEMYEPSTDSNIRQIRGKGRLSFGKPFKVILQDGVFHIMLQAEAVVAKKQNVEHAILEALRDGNAVSKSVLVNGRGARRKGAQQALDALVANGRVVVQDGKFKLAAASDDFPPLTELLNV